MVERQNICQYRLFKERRSNILCEPERYSQAAGSNGLAPINYGVVTNQGYDLEIGYQDQKEILDIP